MRFHEKLRRRAAEVNQSQASAAVGMKPTTISSYLAKGSMPRADIAWKIARALEVPLDWLLDDDLDWPPPERSGLPPLSSLSDSALMAEASRRYVAVASGVREVVREASAIDWVEAARSLLSRPISEAPPEGFARKLRVLNALESAVSDLSQFDASAQFRNYVGADKGLNARDLVTEVKDARTAPGAKEAADYLAARFMHDSAVRHNWPDRAKQAEALRLKLIADLAAPVRPKRKA